MRVRLEIDVQRAATGLIASLFKRKYLSVLHAFVRIGSSTCDIALRIDNDSANVRIGRSESESLTRQVQRAAQKLLVVGRIRHSDLGDESTRRSSNLDLRNKFSRT